VAEPKFTNVADKIKKPLKSKDNIYDFSIPSRLQESAIWQNAH
jgi:hypothetical protein